MSRGCQSVPPFDDDLMCKVMTMAVNMLLIHLVTLAVNRAMAVTMQHLWQRQQQRR